MDHYTKTHKGIKRERNDVYPGKGYCLLIPPSNVCRLVECKSSPEVRFMISDFSSEAIEVGDLGWVRAKGLRRTRPDLQGPRSSAVALSHKGLNSSNRK